MNRLFILFLLVFCIHFSLLAQETVLDEDASTFPIGWNLSGVVQQPGTWEVDNNAFVLTPPLDYSDCGNFIVVSELDATPIGTSFPEATITFTCGSFSSETQVISNIPFGPSVYPFTLPSSFDNCPDLQISWIKSSGMSSRNLLVDNITIFAGSGSCLVPFPVELVAFEVSKNHDQVRIDWTTATEINNDYFVVEHAADGRSFEPIAKINGAGHSAVESSYSFIHDFPAKGLNYYRLVQVDFDGAKTYSHIKTIELDQVGFAVKLFPSLVQDELTISLSDELSDDGFAIIYDVSGRMIRTISLRRKNIQHLVQLSDLDQGVYFVGFRIGEVARTLRFVKM